MNIMLESMPAKKWTYPERGSSTCIVTWKCSVSNACCRNYKREICQCCSFLLSGTGVFTLRIGDSPAEHGELDELVRGKLTLYLDKNISDAICGVIEYFYKRKDFVELI